MIHTSDQIDEIAKALVKAQAEIKNVEKDAANPGFKRENKPSTYATLAAALDEVRPKFAAHGIYLLQMPINGEGPNIGIATRLLHESGQWIESTLYVAPAQFTAQGAGSVITYLRRYCLMAMTGVAPEDDDGNAASVAAPQPQRAGMVRAADVPRNDARPLAAEPAANGKAATSTEASHTRSATGNGQHKLTPAELFRNAMRGHFSKAETPAAIEKLIADTSADLARVHKDAPEVYAEIMTDATNAKNALYGETG